MPEAKAGDTVKVHYTGKLKDGTQFDSSQGREPLEFTIDEGKIIPGFEQAVIGMSPGEHKTVVIPEAQAYGPRREEAVQEAPKSALPPEIEPELQVGMQLQANNPQGQPMILTVTGIGDESITLDANHPLAGQDLVFDLELVEIA